MKTDYGFPTIIILTVTLGLSAQVQPVLAQGCIVARSSSVASGPQTQGGYMAPGEWDISIGYRHQYSFRHFVGDVEQKQRIQMGNQVMNKINLLNLAVTYQATPRFSFTVNAPLLLASRRSNNSAYTTTAQGIGDVIVSAQGWLWKPSGETPGNVAVGLGIMLPTGKDNLVNRVEHSMAEVPGTSCSITPYSQGPEDTASCFNGSLSET